AFRMKHVSISLLALSLALGLCLGAAAQEAQPAPTRPLTAPPRPQKLPTPAQWDAAPGVKSYVDKAKALAGNDPDLQFDAGIFCKASGGASNEDRQSLGVPNSEPRLQPYPTPRQAVALPAARLADNW